MAGNRGGFKGHSAPKRGGFGNNKFNRINKRPQNKFNNKNSNNNTRRNREIEDFDPEIDSEDEGPEEEEIGRYENEDSEDGFFSDDNINKKNGEHSTKKKNKHAPKETKINHRPVSVVRDIPGLVVRNRDVNTDSFSSRDIRFDTALGRSVDYDTVRKQYAFLDEYREQEIKEMQKILKDKKMLGRMDEDQIEDLKYKLQSTRSKLESLKKKDREKQALKEYIKENKETGNNNKFLTRAEKRKVLLVDRFEHMNSKQKTKSIERKRKRKLGKEMRALEFSGNRN